MTILERFYPDKAVIDDGEKQLILPPEAVRGCAEGDVITEKDGIYVPDKPATELRRKKLLALQASLWEEK